MPTSPGSGPKDSSLAGDRTGNFDLHPDGQRFAVLKAPETQSTKIDKIVLIFNFFDELRRIAPKP